MSKMTESEKKATPEVAKKSGSSKKMIVIIVAALLVICCLTSVIGGAFAFSRSNSDKDEKKSEDSKEDNRNGNRDEEASNNGSSNDNNNDDSDSEDESSDDSEYINEYFDSIPDGEIPENMPKEIPIYEDYDKVGFSSVTAKDDGGIEANLSLLIEEGTTKEVYEELKAQATSMGWEVSSDTNFGTSYVTTFYKSDEYEKITITIVESVVVGLSIVYNYVLYAQ